MKLGRRNFLTAAALGAGAMALPKGWLIGEAKAAGGLTPYPVLQICLIGGIDQAMHFIGRSNMSNRPTSGFKTGGPNLVYYPETVAPAGATDFEPHIADMALLRGYSVVTRTHEVAQAMQWYGETKKPWANYLASELLKSASVPKPCGIALTDVLHSGEAKILQPGDASPNPAGAAERILDAGGFFSSLSAGDTLPKADLQGPTTKLIDGLNLTSPGPAQTEMADLIAQSNLKAGSLLKPRVVPSGPVWPPSQATMTALGLTQRDLTAKVQNSPSLKGNLALAYQALSHNVSHVLSVFSDNLWDTHSDNVTGQIAASKDFFPAFGKLIALMKATVSPIDPSKSLFDTTNIWVTSEFNRGTEHDTLGLFGVSETGLQHWEHTSAMFLGGRFKRGVAIGDLSTKWQSVAIDPVTGSTNGAAAKVMKLDNVLATVFKAAGADPAAYTTAQPIDALLAI